MALTGYGPYRWETQEMKLSSRGFHVIRFTSLQNSLVNHLGLFSGGQTEACFWPVDNMQPSSPPLRLHHAAAQATIFGKVSLYDDSYNLSWLIASSVSGLYYVVVMKRTHSEAEFHDESGDELEDEFEDELEDELAEDEPVFSLHLFQYNLDPPAVQTRQLEVPPTIDLAETQGLAIDERLGVIYLTHAMGQLLVIPYA